jgi:hypothetical protein
MTTMQGNTIYETLLPTWRALADCFSGRGGFSDGSYLIAHPREYLDHDQPNPSQPTAKLIKRRKLARYVNFAAVIVEAKRSALFRKQPTRTIADHVIAGQAQAWWNDVDGRGTHIDDFLAQAWVGAAVFGHVFLYMDRPTDGRRNGAPFVRAYTPLDVLDWLEDEDGCIVSVKLLEAKPRASFDQATGFAYRVRTVDAERWTVSESGGTEVASGEHGFGRLPGAFLFARRSPLCRAIGHSVLDNPQLYIDLYNLDSEIREILRNQTFGILNVPLGTGQDAATVEEARAMIGTRIGTDQIMFSPGDAKYVSPPDTNVTVYQSERDALVRQIYRATNIPWSADSRDAESEGSLMLKREDMNQVLSAYADELERTDYELAELLFRSSYGAGGPAHLETAELAIKYPDTFDVQPFKALLDEAQAAFALDMPPAVRAEQQKRLLDTIRPDLAPEKKAELIVAIEAHVETADPIARSRARMRGLGAAFDEAQRGTPPRVQ